MTDDRHAQPIRGQRVGVVAAWLNLVVVGVLLVHLSGGITLGWGVVAGMSNPINLLGTSPDHASCITAPLEVGHGSSVFCSTYSAVVSPEGMVQVVSVYAGGNPVVKGYAGRLPKGLEWGDSIDQVIDRLGEPHRLTDIYGPPTMVYMVDDAAYGSLELQFNAAGGLVRLNACLTH
jgi:hypothetical protein